MDEGGGEQTELTVQEYGARNNNKTQKDSKAYFNKRYVFLFVYFC